MKMDAKKLRKMKTVPAVKRGKHDIYIILDNVLDTYNIGAVFRLADAVSAKKIFLCGYTEIPPNIRIKRASINTVGLTEWKYFNKTTDAVLSLKSEIRGLKIIAIEQSLKSISYINANYKFPIALIIGNETHGVSKEVLELCDQIVELPMLGVNISLNTMVSLAIILYKVIEENGLP